MAVATAEVIWPASATAQASADPLDVALSPDSSSRNTIQSSSGGIVPLSVRAVTDQNADLTQWQTATGAVTTRVRDDGSVIIASATRPPLQMFGVDRGNGTRYATQFGIFASNPGLITNGFISINGVADEPFSYSSVTIGGRSTYMLGIASDVGSAPIVVLQGQGPILEAYRADGFRQVEWDANGVLAFRGGGTLNPGLGNTVGDKIGLYGSSYGFGVQSGRLVAFVNGSAKFAIRTTAPSGHRSSGPDVITLGENGDIESLRPGRGLILTSPDGTSPDRASGGVDVSGLYLFGGVAGSSRRGGPVEVVGRGAGGGLGWLVGRSRAGLAGRWRRDEA